MKFGERVFRIWAAKQEQRRGQAVLAKQLYGSIPGKKVGEGDFAPAGYFKMAWLRLKLAWPKLKTRWTTRKQRRDLRRLRKAWAVTPPADQLRIFIQLLGTNPGLRRQMKAALGGQMQPKIVRAAKPAPTTKAS